jgi:uncharacterized membrane protein YtjA (UPF0391 family)
MSPYGTNALSRYTNGQDNDDDGGTNSKTMLSDCAAILLTLVIIATILGVERSIHALRAGRNRHREDSLSRIKSEPSAEAPGWPQGTIHRSSGLNQQFESQSKGNLMLSWAIIFFILALVAAVFGFSGIASASAGIAQILFFLFLVLFAVSLIARLARSAKR